jgi:hypothetical protein
MKTILLALFFACPLARAGENVVTQDTPNAGDEKKWEVGLGATYGWQNPGAGSRVHANYPGVTFSVGYALTPQDTLFFQADRQRYGISESWGSWYTNSYSGVVGNRHWFSALGKWRPYAQFGVGAVWEKSDWSGPDSLHPGQTFHGTWEGGWNLVTMAGVGARYALLPKLNLDLGANLQHVGSPWTFHGRDFTLNFLSAISMEF